MRKKVSTLLDEALFRRARMEAVRQGKQFSEVVGEALEAYLSGKLKQTGESGAVAESWGALKTKPEVVRRILKEEDGLFDAG
jgi:hypothetical protein